MAFMLKKKRYKFQVELFLEELNAVTFPSAVLFAKLRLLDGGNFCEISSRYKASLICFLLSKASRFKCDSFRACAACVPSPRRPQTIGAFSSSLLALRAQESLLAGASPEERSQPEPATTGHLLKARGEEPERANSL